MILFCDPLSFLIFSPVCLHDEAHKIVGSGLDVICKNCGGISYYSRKRIDEHSSMITWEAKLQRKQDKGTLSFVINRGTEEIKMYIDIEDF